MTPEELAGKLTPAAFQALLEPFMQRATLLALRESQPETPVDTGTLRRSETTRVEAGGLRGFVGTNVEYAPFVHKRVPFFARGVEAATPAIEAEAQKIGVAFFAQVAK